MIHLCVLRVSVVKKIVEVFYTWKRIGQSQISLKT